MRLDHLLSKEKVGVGKVCCLIMSALQKGKYKELLVAMRLGETPVPIPNTMVKTREAESTALVTVWEGRWLPDL